MPSQEIHLTDRVCDCEHVSHFEGLRRIHPYCTHESGVEDMQTDYGTYHLCQSCRELGHGRIYQDTRIEP